MAKTMSNPTTIEDVAKAAMQNHIWVNAMSAYKPTDEQCIALGRQIYEWLDNRELVIPSYSPGLNSGKPSSAKNQEIMQSMCELTPMLYLSINKS